MINQIIRTTFILLLALLFIGNVSAQKAITLDLDAVENHVSTTWPAITVDNTNKAAGLLQFSVPKDDTLQASFVAYLHTLGQIGSGYGATTSQKFKEGQNTITAELIDYTSPSQGTDGTQTIAMTEEFGSQYMIGNEVITAAVNAYTCGCTGSSALVHDGKKGDLEDGQSAEMNSKMAGEPIEW